MRSFFFLLFFPLSIIAQSRSDTRPNILLIIADDMSLNAGIYGDGTIQTPAIDGLGRDGVIFQNAHCTASSCTPSRAGILTSRYPHQLKEGGNLWGFLPSKYPTYTNILSAAGYAVGLEGKGWGPGNYKAGGYTDNPAGKNYKNFEEFLETNGTTRPFCFWVGSYDPHRPYDPKLKNSVQFNESSLRIPAWMPDNADTRNDFKDYYAEVKRFDTRVGQCIDLLKKKGLYEHTLIIVTSDNGSPFPRIKANNYKVSTNIPLVIRWGSHFKNGTQKKEMISLLDLAPTILEAAQLPAPNDFTGASLMPLLSGKDSKRQFESVFTERERHAEARAGNTSFPIRAIQTHDFIYINNLRPERWPAGDPVGVGANGPFGDIDNGPTKKAIVDNQKKQGYADFAKWSLSRRPGEELYDLKKDPDQLVNIAADKRYAKTLMALRKELKNWRKSTKDPVADSGADVFDTYKRFSGKDAH